MKWMPLIFLLFISSSVFAQEIIDVTIKGISDNVRNSVKEDRLEAVLDAKRQACEKAGVKIESKTTVENYQLLHDYLESKSKTILLPGFQIIDIGYVANGTYQVVLSGRVRSVEADNIRSKELRYAKSLHDRGKYKEAKKALLDLWTAKDASVSEKIKEDAMYYYIKWGYSSRDMEEVYEKFKAYYPASKHLGNLEKYIRFSKKPIYLYSKEQDSVLEWQKGKYRLNKEIYTNRISALRHVMTFKDFYGKQHSIFIRINYFKKDKIYENLPKIYNHLPDAYQLVATYFNGNVETLISGGKTPENGKTLIDDFRKARSVTLGSRKTNLCSFSRSPYFNNKKLYFAYRVNIFYQDAVKIDCNFKVRQSQF